VHVYSGVPRRSLLSLEAD